MKLWAYIIAAILLAGAIGYGVHIVKKANRAEAAEARADAAEKGRADDMKEIAKRLDADAADRKAFSARFDAIEKKFDNLKIPPAAELVQNREVPSVEGKCLAPGVGPEFVRVYNQASEPVTAP